MANDLNYELEIADDNATLYLLGDLHASDAVTLERACDTLPVRVRTLRLDMHGVTNMAEDAMEAVRSVLRFWRTSRGGSFRLSFATESIIATYSEGSFVQGRARRQPRELVDSASPAMTAAFL